MEVRIVKWNYIYVKILSMTAFAGGGESPVIPHSDKLSKFKLNDARPHADSVVKILSLYLVVSFPGYDIICYTY